MCGRAAGCVEFGFGMGSGKLGGSVGLRGGIAKCIDTVEFEAAELMEIAELSLLAAGASLGVQLSALVSK